MRSEKITKMVFNRKSALEMAKATTRNVRWEEVNLISFGANSTLEREPHLTVSSQNSEVPLGSRKLPRRVQVRASEY